MVGRFGRGVAKMAHTHPQFCSFTTRLTFTLATHTFDTSTLEDPGSARENEMES